MIPTILIFAALTGTAALAFLFGHAVSRLVEKKKMAVLEQKLLEMSACQETLSDLKKENEALQFSLQSNMELLQGIDNQFIDLQVKLQFEQQENKKLRAEQTMLLEKPPMKVEREIEVIREVPVLVFREKQKKMTLKEKADIIVETFKAGARKKIESRQ